MRKLYKMYPYENFNQIYMKAMRNEDAKYHEFEIWDFCQKQQNLPVDMAYIAYIKQKTRKQAEFIPQLNNIDYIVICCLLLLTVFY